MEWVVLPKPWHHGEWVVEAINHASEGEVYRAIFSGPSAKERAEEYAAWKRFKER